MHSALFGVDMRYLLRLGRNNRCTSPNSRVLLFGGSVHETVNLMRLEKVDFDKSGLVVSDRKSSLTRVSSIQQGLAPPGSS